MGSFSILFSMDDKFHQQRSKNTFQSTVAYQLQAWIYWYNTFVIEFI